MKFYAPFVICLFLFFKANGQQKKIDSLQNVLEKSLVQDTVRLKVLNELSYSYYAINPAEGVRIAEQAILLGKKVNQSSHLASAYANKGHNHSAQGQDSLALAMYDIAIKIHETDNNEKAIRDWCILINLIIIELMITIRLPMRFLKLKKIVF